MRRELIKIIKIAFAISALVCTASIFVSAQTEARLRVAVLDFGDSPTGARVAEKIREAVTTDEVAVQSGIVVVDRNLANAAARGNGFNGSLNLTTQEARDLGAAIGCDFFIIGDANTVKRSPSSGKDYFESYAAIFVVSARTGQLILWRRASERRDNSDEAEQAFLKTFTSDTITHAVASIRKAAQSEAAERVAAVEAPAATIDVMSDDDNGKGDTRAPRPYRRLKPPYPDAASQAEVEAVVDVLVDIDSRGEVEKIQVARWAGYGLDESVTQTVKQMHFFPAMREGVAIPMRVLLRYNFRHTTPDESTSNPAKTTPKIIIKPRP